MKFTLVSTIFNEANRLHLTIEDLNNQSVKPDEIIITDAGSTDGTIDIVKKWQQKASYPIKLLIKPSCNVAEGRNLAIRSSVHEIIVSTDFGCRFHKDWFKSLTDPFKDQETMVVCGKYSVIEKDQITLPAKAAFIISNGYHVDVSSKNFIPSSRSIAYKKEVFEEIGGYCEWLTLAADDSVFGMELIAKKFKFTRVDLPYVFWGRHSTFKGFNKEAFRYGLGEGEARIGRIHFIKTFLQLSFRLGALVSFLAFLFLYFFKENLVLISAVFLTLSLLGFRQYLLHIVNPWLKFKSSKYSFEVFLAAIYLFEANQIHFLKGYIKGYSFSNSRIKAEASSLKSRLKYN